jgi:uncharacterized metal-binding protein
MYTCAACGKNSCETGKLDDAPKNCPGAEAGLDEIRKLYEDETNRKLAVNSALTEADGYCQKTRLEEIMDFADRCGFTKLGLAFCAGFKKEASVLTRVLTHNGFQVDSVVCKNCGVPKESLGIEDGEKVHPGTFEPMCNPIGQAIFLNRAGTELNLILGLCVGHDSLFIKYSQAPVTVFAAKDRVLAHNPLGAVYLADGYYREKLFNRKKRT